MNAPLELLNSAIKKYPQEDPVAATEAILRYAAYLAVDVLGQHKAEHSVLRAIDDYAKFKGEP